MPIIDVINFFYPSNFEHLHLKWELKGCVVITSHVVFLLFEKQPVTNFPCTSFTGPHNSVLSSQIERETLFKACTEKGIVGKGKGCYTLIQGVTAPLNCRVVINPRSYVLISSSIPLCHLQLSDKLFRNIGNHLKANLQHIDRLWSTELARGQRSYEGIIFATDRWPFNSVKDKLRTGSRIIFQLSVKTSSERALG